MTETLDTIGYDLAGARALVEMTRQALQAAPQGIPEFERAVARLERIEEEVARVERVVAGQAVGAR